MAFWNKNKVAVIGGDSLKVNVASADMNANHSLLNPEAFAETSINQENVEEEDVKPVEEEYIWVDGYKALYPSMKASYGDITYEVGKEFALPDGEDPQV